MKIRPAIPVAKADSVWSSKAVIRKLAAPETLLNYQAVLDSLSANMQTSFQLPDFYALQNQDYLGAVGNIEQQQLGGTGAMMNDIYYNFRG